MSENRSFFFHDRGMWSRFTVSEQHRARTCFDCALREIAFRVSIRRGRVGSPNKRAGAFLKRTTRINVRLEARHAYSLYLII